MTLKSLGAGLFQREDGTIVYFDWRVRRWVPSCIQSREMETRQTLTEKVAQGKINLSEAQEALSKMKD